MLASQMRFVMSFVGPTLLTRHLRNPVSAGICHHANCIGRGVHPCKAQARLWHIPT